MADAVLNGLLAVRATASRLEEAERDLMLPNPEYRSAVVRGACVDEIPKLQRYFSVVNGTLFLPRECDLARRIRLTKKVKDSRSPGRPVRFRSRIRHTGDRVYQKDPVEALSQATTGLLIAECGSGKTVMALSAIARVKTTALIVVQDTELLRQWAEEIEKHLGVPASSIAIIRGPSCDYKNKPIGVALIQSLSKRKYPKEFYEHWGLLVYDEVHRMGAMTWHPVAGMFPSVRRWGLTATRQRADGMDRLVEAHLGSVIYELERGGLMCRVLAVRSRLRLMTEDYIQPWNRRVSVPKLLTAVASSHDRNKLILDTIQPAIEKGHRVLIVSSRNDQLTAFHRALKQGGVSSGLLIGATPGSVRGRMREKAQVLCVTAAYGKQALDVPMFNVLVMGTPIPANPPYLELKQAVGRIRREKKGKAQPRIVDLVDQYIPTLCRWWNRRRSWYTRQGFTVKVKKG